MSAVDFIGPNSINYQAYQLPVMATAGQKISGTLVEAVRMNLVTNEGFVHKVGHPFRCPPTSGIILAPAQRKWPTFCVHYEQCPNGPRRECSRLYVDKTTGDHVEFTHSQHTALVALNNSTQLLTTFGIECHDKPIKPPRAGSVSVDWTPPPASPSNIDPLAMIPSSDKKCDLIRKTIKRVNQINRDLPDSIHYQGSVEKLTSDAPKLGEFLQQVYDHQLCLALGSVANIPANADSSVSAAKIKEWVHGTEAQKIEELFLKSSSLFFLPKEICELKGLKNLDLSDNHIKFIPDEIGDLTALTQLDLDKNELKSIPTSIGKLANLIHLNLAENHLKIIPSSINNLGALKEFLLTDNKIKGLPEQLQGLKTLQTLLLNTNRLESIPSSLGCLTTLTELDLSANGKLSAIPKEMKNLKGLTHLGLVPTSIKDSEITELLKTLKLST